MRDGIWPWFLQADMVSQATAALLLLLSLASWVVLLAKLWLMASSGRAVPRSIGAFWQAKDLATGQTQVQSLDRHQLVLPMLAALQQAQQDPGAGAALGGQGRASLRLTRGLRDALQAASRQLHWGQTLLASVGATAPFVGLLGTVWGIHHALLALTGGGPVGIEQLAGPVGEALVMTAAGLAVALPAVLAYNLLGRSAAHIEALLEGFAHDVQSVFDDQAPQPTGAGHSHPPSATAAH